MKSIRVGLFGLGCVGNGLYEIVKKQKKYPIVFHKICVKDLSKPRKVPLDLLTSNPKDILENKEIDIIIELINGVDEAFEIVSNALKNRIPVISANKKMIATYFGQLKTLSEEFETPLLYEGAVCGAIPILRTIDQYYQLDKINSIEGIFNGTTNYILSQQHDENTSFDQSLKNAQQLGFAELEPSSDVDGFDAKYKLKILIAHTFGVDVSVENILNLGIKNIHKNDIIYAKNKGYKYKLLAKVIRNENSLTALVAPFLVKPESIAYTVNQEKNYVKLTSDYGEEYLLSGKGAGSLPTGIAVFSDVVNMINYTKKYQLPSSKLSNNNNVLLEVLISSTKSSLVNQLEMKEEYQVFDSTDYYYKTGLITINELLKHQSKEIFISVTSDKILNPIERDLEVIS